MPELFPQLLAMTMFGVELSFDGLRHYIIENGFWPGVGICFALLFMCGLGLPLPEDVPLILAGALLLEPGASLHDWLVVGAACWAGIMGGDVCLYFIGKKLGPNVTRVPLLGRHITVARLQRVEKLFERYGIFVVGVGRLFAGIRAAMVVTAGTIRFHFFKFFVADGLAAIVSGGMFVLLGHWIGKQLTAENFERFKHYFVIAAIALVIGIVAYILIRRRFRKPIGVVVEKKIEQAAKKAET